MKKSVLNTALSTAFIVALGFGISACSGDKEGGEHDSHEVLAKDRVDEAAALARENAPAAEKIDFPETTAMPTAEADGAAVDGTATATAEAGAEATDATTTEAGATDSDMAETAATDSSNAGVTGTDSDNADTAATSAASPQ